MNVIRESTRNIYYGHWKILDMHHLYYYSFLSKPLRPGKTFSALLTCQRLNMKRKIRHGRSLLEIRFYFEQYILDLLSEKAKTSYNWMRDDVFIVYEWQIVSIVVKLVIWLNRHRVNIMPCLSVDVNSYNSDATVIYIQNEITSRCKSNPISNNAFVQTHMAASIDRPTDRKTA